MGDLFFKDEAVAVSVMIFLWIPFDLLVAIVSVISLSATPFGHSGNQSAPTVGLDA